MAPSPSASQSSFARNGQRPALHRSTEPISYGIATVPVIPLRFVSASCVACPTTSKPQGRLPPTSLTVACL